MLEDKKLRLVDLFHTLDADHSGFVDAAELHAAFGKHGLRVVGAAGVAHDDDDDEHDNDDDDDGGDDDE
jgi:hypothetical protein